MEYVLDAVWWERQFHNVKQLILSSESVQDDLQEQLHQKSSFTYIFSIVVIFFHYL